MKFWELFRYEFAYQLRRSWPWLIFLALVVFSFLMTRDGSLAEALYDDFFVNSPFAIAKTTVTGSLIWLLVAAGIAGDAAARDAATGMHPLTYSVPISRFQYLGGRFLAAFLINGVLLLAVPAGIILGVYLPGVDTQLIGPFRTAAYLTAYGYLALPNAFVATAVQFALATRTGRPMAAYLGSVLLFFMAYVVGIFLYFQGRQDLANLLDPIGVHFILSEMSHLWTPTEKSWRLLELRSTVLINRLLWVGVAGVILGINFLRFSFTHRTERMGWKGLTRLFSLAKTAEKGSPRLTPGIGSTAPTFSLPLVPRRFGFGFQVRKTLALARASFWALATNWAGLLLLTVIPALTVMLLLDQMESNGVPLVPTTVRVLQELTVSLTSEMSRWVFIPLLLIFFSGELVWREREAGLGEITDAMPGSEWPLLLGRFLGLALIIAVFLGLQMAAGMVAQVMLDYWHFETGLYLTILFGLQLPEYLLYALLALVLHIFANQKYVGHLVSVIAYVMIALAPTFGLEHNLLIYSASPEWSYTDMRGFGASIAPWLWFKLYWAAWALLLAVAARLLWVRGRDEGLRVRLQLVSQRLTPATASTAIVAVGLILTLGGYIFYNTNVLNTYLSTAESAERKAEYERRYGRYAATPQPDLAATRLQVEIYPDRRAVAIRGSYQLINRSGQPINFIHVATIPGVETETRILDQTATLRIDDPEHGHRIFALRQPLGPGDSLQLAFTVRIRPNGFRENGVISAIVDNGTHFTNGDCLPAIGYQPSRELTSAADRRTHRLPARPLIPSLYDVKARKSRGGAIAFDAVLGTDAGQVAVAPGALRRTWSKGGRRYFHYATDAPIGNEWVFLSANYKVRREEWKSPDGSGRVTLQVFHHPGHSTNLNRMLRGIRASLGYYTQQFGPYRFGHLSLIEHPGNGTGMHADPSMILFTEGFSHWTPKDDSKSLDLPYAVTAHEMAHQWTLPYAPVEGAPVMSESLAWYYGMKVVEKARGQAHLGRLLRFMRSPYPYPPIRRGEPLLRGLDPYLSYRRGPFALYTLSEYLGEKQVNGALRRLLETHRKPGAPLATTLDLYRELKAVTPDSLRYLLHDLFEVNTYWELETTKVVTKQKQPGTWEVAVDVQARKVVLDSTGTEIVVPMNDWIELGLFSAAGGSAPNVPLYLQKHRIRSGKQTIVVRVANPPARAGIDPNQWLIDLNTDNNSKEVKINP